MSTPPNSRGDRPHKYHHPTTYFVEERFSKEEIARLTGINKSATEGMGGVMPEQDDPGSLGSILDIACGPGGWLIETALAYPTITELVGIDINARMIAFANQEATARQLSDRVSFQVMDALGTLGFPDDHFDLVNQRLATSFLRTWDWSKLLNEMKRITRTGGIIRLTEAEAVFEGNSPAFNQINDIGIEAYYQAGHLFSRDKRSVINELPNLLDRYGFLDIETRDYVLEYRAGTPGGDFALESARAGMRTIRPFLSKWTQLPANYDELYKQMLEEMQQPGFVATWPTTTIWAKVPEPTPMIG